MKFYLKINAAAIIPESSVFLTHKNCFRMLDDTVTILDSTESKLSSLAKKFSRVLKFLKGFVFNVLIVFLYFSKLNESRSSLVITLDCTASSEMSCCRNIICGYLLLSANWKPWTAVCCLLLVVLMVVMLFFLL